jgi:hypothetical protein
MMVEAHCRVVVYIRGRSMERRMINRKIPFLRRWETFEMRHGAWEELAYINVCDTVLLHFSLGADM